MYPEFTYDLLIREGHLDTFGHVNNAVYLALFEEARWDLITRNGYGLQKVVETGLGPTIVEIQISFLRELHLRTPIQIHTQLLEYPSRVGILRQWMTNPAGDICCDMKMKFGLFDTKARKLVPATPEWLRALGAGEKV